MSGLFGGSGSRTLRVKEFRASGTFVVPAGVKTVELFLVGGGSGSSGNYLGAGGNLVKILYDVSGLLSCPVLIGAGGLVDGNGGDTSFNGDAVAEGGERFAGGYMGVAFEYSVAGQDGFGGHGSNANNRCTFNGGRYGAGATNKGGGGGSSFAGGSGYCRVEWYE